MITSRGRERDDHRRRGVVAAQVAVCLVLLMAMAALTIDIGAMFNARADLQKAADATALAGASVYTTDDMMRIRQGSGDAFAVQDLVVMAKDRVDHVSPLNPSFGSSLMFVEPADMAAGWIDLSSGNSALQTGAPPNTFQALQVVTRRTTEATNGPVQMMFSRVFGITTSDLTATAVGVFDDRFAGVTVTELGVDLLPFTIHEDAFAQELAQGGDQYGYHEDSGAVDSAPDGIREVRLYPYPLSGSGYTEGDGNFGVLNIGTGNQGLDAEVIQIQNGISTEDMIMEIGTASPTFHDDDGSQVSYDMTGSPGLESSLRESITAKIGDVVGFFLHDHVILSGSNAIYRVTEIRYGRVMDIRLTGSPEQRGFFIQPVSYSGSEVRIDPEAPSTGGLVGRLVLAR